MITSLEKIADQSRPGNMIVFDTEKCILSGEGKLNFGTAFDFVNIEGAGRVSHSLDSGKVELQAILGFDFYFSPEALRIMSDEIRLIPTLKSVNLNSEFNKKGMDDLLGAELSSRLKEELDLFGVSRELPNEFNFEILLNDVNLYWNEPTSSFRSKGKIGIGYIGNQPLNVYVDGFIEIQRRRSGDMFDIYLKADESTYYYFSYIRGNMMTQAANKTYSMLIAGLKPKVRKHPKSTSKQSYTYMITVEDRLSRFLQRMTEGDESDVIETDLDGLVQ
jgi:hypothetical protein